MGAHDILEKRLVHAYCRGGHPSSDERDTRQFQQSLDCAILAVGAMQDGKDDVQLADPNRAQGLFLLAIYYTHQSLSRGLSQQKSWVTLGRHARTQRLHRIA